MKKETLPHLKKRGQRNRWNRSQEEEEIILPWYDLDGDDSVHWTTVAIQSGVPEGDPVWVYIERTWDASPGPYPSECGCPPGHACSHPLMSRSRCLFCEKEEEEEFRSTWRSAVIRLVPGTAEYGFWLLGEAVSR